MAFLMARASLLGLMVTSTMASSKTGRDMASENVLIWMDQNTQESISKTNLMEKVIQISRNS